MIHEHETWEGEFEVLTETAKAILLFDAATEEKVWVPISQIDEIHWEKDKRHARVVMSAWIAKEKGFIG